MDEAETPKARKCIFCGDDLKGNRSKEHVLRESWLKRLGHLKSPVHLSLQSEGDVLGERSMAAGALLAGEVCTKCNGGWMDALDHSVEDMVFGLIDNTLRVEDLDTEKRHRLGRWLLKMSCSFKAVDARERRHLSDELLAGVQVDGYLPRGFIAFVGTASEAHSEKVAVGHMDMWFASTPELKEMPQTLRLKFAMQYNSLIIGCAFIDHPNVHFYAAPQMHNVFVVHECELTYVESMLEQLEATLNRQGTPAAVTPLNVQLLAIAVRLGPQRDAGHSPESQ